MVLLNRRNKRTKKNLNKFKNVKFNYAKFVRRHYMEKGEAYISVNVNSIDDIISNYSIKDYEWVNPEFIEYIENCAYYIPVEEAIVIDIMGAKFTEEEREIIERVLKDHFGLQLGDKMIQLEINRRQSYILLVLGLLCLVVSLALYKYMDTVWFSEILAFGLWFFCWEYADMAFISRSELKTEKIEAGQLASVKIKFLEEE